jgi:hypothetical protein
MTRIRPSVFIGSSAEGLKFAKTLQVLLDRSCEVEVWSQGIFGLTQGTLESLVYALDRFDFAILVLTPDDMNSSRGNESPAPRDNVLFELGLFMGRLGRERTFILYDRNSGIKVPSDLAGVTLATFELHQSGNLQASLGAPAFLIEQQIEKLGIIERKRLNELSEAAEEFDNTSKRMQKLIDIIARSRKVELDIVLSQFGSLINRKNLLQIKQDLIDLEKQLAIPDKKEKQ